MLHTHLGACAVLTEDKCSLEGEPVSCTGDGNAPSARDPLYKDGELSLLPAQVKAKGGGVAAKLGGIFSTGLVELTGCSSVLHF